MNYRVDRADRTGDLKRFTDTPANSQKPEEFERSRGLGDGLLGRWLVRAAQDRDDGEEENLGTRAHVR